MIDLEELSDAELDVLHEAVRVEVSRRVTIDNAVARIREINQNVINAAGIKPGDPWDPMMQTRGGYPKNSVVTHGPDGHRFESQIDNNVWEPDEPGDPQSWRWWKNLDDQPAEGEWDPNGHAYLPGDRFTYNGVLYEVRQAHTSQPGWTPDAVPALYLPV